MRICAYQRSSSSSMERTLSVAEGHTRQELSPWYRNHLPRPRPLRQKTDRLRLTTDNAETVASASQGSFTLSEPLAHIFLDPLHGGRPLDFIFVNFWPHIFLKT